MKKLYIKNIKLILLSVNFFPIIRIRCCANWSAHDLRSANDHARARSYIFKIFVQSFFIKTLNKSIYYYFDHFKILIIYIILYYNYKSGLYFGNFLIFLLFYYEYIVY
jgi:hypothetical protein